MESRQEQLFIPRTIQWTEGRGFQRIYSKNPDKQAILAEALLGLRAQYLMHTVGQETAQSLNVSRVIRDFSESFPEFIEEDVSRDPDIGHGRYTVDPQLKLFVQAAIQSCEPDPDA